MTVKNTSLMVALGILALSSSCTKTGSTGPTGPAGPAGAAGPAYTGFIDGHVAFYDQYGSRVYENLGSASLSLNGAAAINPNADGYYIFDSLKTGDYNISASAAGYASTQTNNFQFLTDTLNRDIKLSAIPDFSPITCTVFTALSTPGDSVVLTFSADTRARNCIVFVNNATTVNNQPANYLISYVKAIPANKTSAYIIIPAQDLYDANINSGVQFYGAAYGYVVGDVSVYEDLTTGRSVYNAVSASSVPFTATAP